MAQLQYNPAPDVAPDTSAPDDTQRIQASPAAFGAGVSQAVEGLGSAALDVSKFYGETAADQQTNNYLDASNSIMDGDPSKSVVGPDGQLIPDTGFRGLRGQAALDAWPAVKKQLDDLDTKLGGQLSDPVARQAFENQTRRYRAQALQQAGAHVDQQYRTWGEGVNLTSIQLGNNAAAAAGADDNAFEQAQDQVINGYVKNAGIFPEKYGSPQLAALRGQQDATLARLRGLTGAGDPASAAKAMQVVADSRDILGSLPNYDAIVAHVKEADYNATSMPAIGGLVGNAVGAAQRSVGMPAAAKPLPDMSAVPFAQVKSQIIAKEGPDSLGGYNAVAYNTPGGNNAAGVTPPKPLTEMTIGQVLAFQGDPQNPAPGTIRAATAGKRGPSDVGSTGVGAYQFEQGTLAQNAAAALGPDWQSQPFSAANQDKIAEHLYDTVRGNPQALSNTWAAFSGQGAQGQYPSTLAALQANKGVVMDNARAMAAQMYPNDGEHQQRFADAVSNRLNQTESQLHQQDVATGDVVMGVMASANPPISEQELIASSPQVAQAWQTMQANDHAGVFAVRKMFEANAYGRAAGFGSDFKDNLDRVLAPSNDPNRIQTPQQLAGLVGYGPDAALTNSGVNQLTTLMQGRGTPQGEADAAQMRTFVDNMHNTLTFSNKATGLYDAKGEAKFGQYMAATLPVLVNAQKQGNLAAVLNPASKDYIGATVQTFARTPAQMVRDRLTGEGVDMRGPNNPMTPTGLQTAVELGKISPEEMVWIANKLGFPRPVQKPHIQTPPKQVGPLDEITKVVKSMSDAL